MNRKSFILFAVLSLIVILSVIFYRVSNSSSERVMSVSALAEKEGEKIDRDNLLIVGVDQNYPPFVYIDVSSAKLVGLDIELSKLIAEELGKEIKFVTFSWSEKDEYLFSGKVDMILSAIAITETRKKKYDFSIPYLETKKVGAVRRDSSYKEAKELAGKIASAQKGSSSLEVAQRFTSSNGTFREILQLPDVPDQLVSLLKASSDVAVAEKYTIGYFVQSSPNMFRVINDGIDLDVTKLAVAVKKGNTKLVEDLNKAITEIKADGRLEKAKSRWLTK